MPGLEGSESFRVSSIQYKQSTPNPPISASSVNVAARRRLHPPLCCDMISDNFASALSAVLVYYIYVVNERGKV